MGGLFDSGDSAAKAATRSAKIAADAQMEALDYLKEREALPQQYREGALGVLGGLYGLDGASTQQQFIDEAIQSPLYQAILGGQQAGEEAILRSAAQTGGLRSGNVQEALYDYNTQLQNQALLTAYQDRLSGIQGLANLPSNANAIAQGMAGIGSTQAQGVTAAAQAQQVGQQQQASNIMGVAQLGIGLASMFSDRRLKSNIKHIGEVNGHKWYSWDWNVVAQKMGLTGSCEGCMADEIYETNPDAIIMNNGFLMINYGEII